MKKICENKKCNKVFEPKNKKQRFCSVNCSHSYAAYQSHKKQKLLGVGAWNKINHPGKIGGKIGGKACQSVLKAKRISAFYNPTLRLKISSAGGKIGHKVCKDKCVGAFYNPKINRDIRLMTRKNLNNYYFNGIYFDSMAEREFALNIHYQLEKLSLWKNYQFLIGRCSVDFFIKKHKCFIEFHPSTNGKETHHEYYKRRRLLLDNNGYNKYNLVIIK